MRPHPIAEVFPDIEGEEFDSLVEDIRKHGCLQPLVMYQGRILDGRNRWRACQKLGIKPKTVDYRGDDPIGHVLSLNLNRRHLNDSQRAMVAAKIATLGKGRPSCDSSQENGPIGLFNAPTIEETSKKLNVPERTIRRARRVETLAEPELKRAVHDGDVSVAAAEKLTKARPEVQREAAKNHGAAAPELAKRVDRAKEEVAIAPSIRTFPGVAIPDGLLERASRDIAALDEMDRGCRELARMTTAFEKSRPEDDPPGAPGKQRRRWRENLEALAHLIRAEKPTTICPYCKALPKHCKDCGVCKGRGYCPPQANVPKELLAEGDECGIYVNGKWTLLDVGF